MKFPGGGEISNPTCRTVVSLYVINHLMYAGKPHVGASADSAGI